MKRHITILGFIFLILIVSVTACTDPRDIITPSPTATTAAPTTSAPTPTEKPWSGKSPLFNPQPDSALLPAGTDKVELQVETLEPSEVRYSVGEKLTYEMMTPFAEGAGGTTHKTTIPISPSPAETNKVYVCSSLDTGYVMELKYRSIPALKNDYPRISNLWSQRIGWDAEYDNYLSKLQLAVLGVGDAERLRRIRAVNPDILLFATSQPLEYFWGEPAIPNDYYLKDTNGKRIVLWPGSYRLNLTKPEVVKFNVQRLRNLMLRDDLLWDGAFIDSFILDASINKTDSYGNPIKIDADNDGVEDDPAVLDAAWRAGLLEMVRLWRESMPGAYTTGHLTRGVDDLGDLFDGDNLGFICVDVIDGRLSFGSAFNRYLGWSKGRLGSNISVIDTGAPNELGYGYGVYAGFDNAERLIPHDVLEFTRTWYPTMRFGLAFALMGNGLYERHFSDVLYCEEWWYDEFDFHLGAPLGEAYFTEKGQKPPLFSDGGFEKTSSHWKIGTQRGAEANLTYVNDPARGGRVARVEVTYAPGNTEPYFASFFREGLKVEEGVTYQLRFSAKADAPHKIHVDAQHMADNWEVLGLYEEVTLGTEWKDYEMAFTATGTREQVGLQFFVASAKGTVYIDDVILEEQPRQVYRRDFEKGIALLNGTDERQTVRVGEGYARFKGDQAPRWQYILDDHLNQYVTYYGQWKVSHYDTPEWQVDPPFYHDWGNSCRESSDPGAYAEYDLNIPEDGTYTVKVWLPNAPNIAERTTKAVYEIISGGKVVASVGLDQSKSKDVWFTVGTANLSIGDKPRLRLRNAGGGVLYADAVSVESEARYNDGSVVTEVTLEPYDGILLRRQ